MIKERTRRRELPSSLSFRRILIFGGLALATLALPAASGATTLRSAAGARAGQTTESSRLQADQELFDGSALVSPSGRYRLVLQSDGNLVLYWEGHPLWNTGTRGDAPDHLVMQNDGNLVLYQGLDVLWDSKSGGGERSSAYYLILQNDGSAVIDSPAGKPIWTTNTDIQPGLQLGDAGSSVLRLQEILNGLGYWVGPANGVFGDSTQQAVWALQKAAGLGRDGVVGTQTIAALASGVVPTPRPASGNLIEVDLEDDLLMVMQNGKLAYTLNTSTGGGYTYTDKGVTSLAITPKGLFHIFGVIDGLDVDSLGRLWRPRFFTESGIAIHGDSYVPPYPVSHGCVRVSDEAINWIWADNIAPIGEEVWVF
jgi:peptidoglycan hydrolase-like protein with peptidoglycan-binding domain